MARKDVCSEGVGAVGGVLRFGGNYQTTKLAVAVFAACIRCRALLAFGDFQSAIGLGAAQ